ncbi:MAG: glycosyltransferase family 4 protein [Gemmatimonadota bacterium]|nr:glycosyltransferase family 1 protein [Gemmatimonadota bacterium]
MTVGAAATPPVRPRERLAEGLRVALFSDTYPPQVNGVARTLARLAEAIRARGGAVRVFCTEDPDAEPHPDVVRYPSTPFWAYPQLQLALPRFPRAKTDLAAWQPTLVHAATPFGVGLSGRHAARALGLPFVTSYHTSLSAYARFYRLGALSEPGWAFLRWFHNSGRRTYCPTVAVQREIEAHHFTHTAIWSRGVETHRFAPAFRSAAMRAELGADDDTMLVTYVGRIAVEKGLPVLARAITRVVAERGARKVRFALAGDGPYMAEMRGAVPAEVTFTGMLGGERLSQFYAAGDVFVFPSVTDTFGNVLMEAMASGVPIVGAEAGPTRELVGEDRGLLFPEGDDAACAAALLGLADDPGRRRAMAAAGLAYAGARSWDVIFDDLIADYRHVVDAAAAERA